MMGGIAQIPFGAVDRFAARYGIVSIDDFDVFLRHLMAMDAAYIKAQNSKLEGSGDKS